MTPLAPQDDAHNEVFMKTISFFCALTEKGCAFSSAVEADLDSTVEHVLDSATDATGMLVDDLHNPVHSRQHGKGRKCRARLVLRHDEFNQPYIEYISSYPYRHCFNKFLHKVLGSAVNLGAARPLALAQFTRLRYSLPSCTTRQ